MKDYSNYHPRFKDVVLENGRATFEQQLNGFEGRDILINNKEKTRALIRYHKNPLSEFEQNRKITFWHEENVKRGDIIKTLNDNRVFILLSEINQNELIKYALIRETNHKIKWIDNGKLIIKPSIITAKTLYTTGIKNESLHQIPDGMIGIHLPYDEDTKKLNRGQSFIFNKAKYKITFYNEIELNGLLSLICSEEVIDERIDDTENKISNRYDEFGNDRLKEKINSAPPEDNDSSYTILLSGVDKLMASFDTKYTANVLNKDTFVEVEDKQVRFEIDGTSLAKITSQDNKKCVVKANDNFKYGKFTLKAILVDNEAIFKEKEVRVIGL